MNMMATINHPTIADEDEANGVEIIPTTGTATDESPNIIVDAPAPAPPQAMPWRKVVIGICALCATGGVSYLLAGSGSIASSNMKMMNLQTVDAIKKGGYTFTLFGDDAFCNDDQGNYYPYVFYDPASSAEECGQLCSKCPGNGQKDLVLRGFHYLGSSSTCFCLVDSGISFDKTVCEGATDDYDSALGSGEVTSIDPCIYVVGEQCWKASSKGAKATKTKSSKQPIRRKLGQKDSKKSE